MPFHVDLTSLSAIAAAVALAVLINLRRVAPWRPLLVAALLVAICLLEYRPTPRRDLALGLGRLAAFLRASHGVSSTHSRLAAPAPDILR